MEHQLLGYANNINIFGENINPTKKKLKISIRG
jgi:hypothetical protein